MPDKQDVSTQSLIQNNGIGVQNNTNQYHENHLQSCSHHISSMRRVHNTSGSSYPTTCPKLPHSPHAIIQTPSHFQASILHLPAFHAQHGHPQALPRRLVVHSQRPATLSAA
jgi:hypothetical protein